MKGLERILKVVGVVVAVAGVVMLVVRYWEKLTGLCPCNRQLRDSEEDEWAKEAMDYADVD